MITLREKVAEAVEQFICTEYQVSKQDADFTRDAHLFELGFVDSVGFLELLKFIETKYQIEIIEVPDDFPSINRISEVVCSLCRKGL